METSRAASEAGATTYGLKKGLVIGDVYDSRRTPAIPPNLSKYGFDLADPVPFDRESIARVRGFLSSAPKIRSPNGWYSYGLKHVVEEAIGQYVANGECIAACILSGFVVKQELRTSSPALNAMIGISKQWVKEQIAEAKRRKVAPAWPSRLEDPFETLHKEKNQMSHYTRNLRVGPAHNVGPAMP